MEVVAVKSRWLIIIGIILGALLSTTHIAYALGQLEIKCTPEAFLLIDGENVAPKPMKKLKIGLEPGRHVIRAFAAGYLEEDWSIEVRAAGKTTVDIVLAKLDQDRDQMVLIDGGTFQMGVDQKRAEWMVKRLKVKLQDTKDFQPVHDVNVKPFYIDKYEVTNNQYLKFVQATNHKPPKHWQYGEPPKGKEDYPVVNVSYDDAAAYAKWVGKRLPAEAEWEMAARGDSGHIFPWGQVFRSDRANTKQSSFKSATITGRYEKGCCKCGCFDMGGNVAEWTTSWYDAYPGQTLSDPAAGKKTHRVVRGGSWKSEPFQVTTVARDKLPQTSKVNYVGFRCVRDK